MQAEQNKDPTKRQMTKIAREAAKFTVQMMKADGIGTAEFDFIHLVRHNPGMTQADVRAALKIDKGAAALYWRSKNQRRAGFPDVTARVQQMNGEEIQDEEHGKSSGAPAGPGAELLRKPEAGAGGGNGIGPDL